MVSVDTDVLYIPCDSKVNEKSFEFVLILCGHCPNVPTVPDTNLIIFSKFFELYKHLIILIVLFIMISFI